MNDLPRDGVIRIRRVHTNHFQQPMRVAIDGEKVGKLSQGKTKDFPVAAGEHTVRLSALLGLQWSPDRVVTVRSGEVTELYCGPSGGIYLELY